MLKPWKYCLVIISGLILSVSGCGSKTNEAAPVTNETTSFVIEEKEKVRSTEEKKYTSRGTPFADNEGLEIFDSIDMIQVESSALAAIGYSKADKVLAVEFLKSGKYMYYDVPESVFKEFLKAESKGHYFNSKVKGQYDCEKIE